MQLAIHGAKGKLGALIHSLHPEAIIIERGASVPSSVEVVIDVTSAQGTKELISRMNGAALLVGSTGDLPWIELEQYAIQAPVAVVSNFSVGIPLLIELLQQALRVLPDGWDIEIVEAHHNQKKDAPSGTAKRIARSIKEVNGMDVPMHALRVGDTFGDHTVWMCGPGERLELRHVATNRSVFAIGALRWAKWLLNQPNGLIKP